MTHSTHQDRFDKADAAFKKACADVNDSYAVWSEACDRLMRIGRERLDAWDELVTTALVVDGEQLTGKEG